MKKLSLVLATAFMIVLFAMSVNAREITARGMCGENLYWDYYGNTKELIIYGEGDMRDYVSTSYPGGTPSAPWRVYDVKDVIINDGVTSIGEYAFYKMKTIENVTFSETVVSIEERAFFGLEKLEYLNFPSKLASVGKEAFSEVKSLKKLNLPNKLNTIGDLAFSKSLNNIEEVIIPESVKSIGFDAFRSAYGPKKIFVESRFELKVYGGYFSSADEDCTIFLVYSREEVDRIIDLDKIGYRSDAFGDANLVFNYKANSKIINFCTVYGLTDQYYYGELITIPIQVYDDSENYFLKEGIDYSITYKNNDGINMATITITGIGDYSCTMECEFQILPTITVSNVADGIKIQWYAYKYNKKYKADDVHYTLYRKSGNDDYKWVHSWSGTPDDLASEDDEQFVYSKDLKKIYFIDKAAKTNGRKYTYKLEISVDALNEKKFTLEPTKASIYRLNVPQNVSITKGYKTLTVNYDKNSKATGYEIYRSNAKNGTYKKIKTTTGTSYKNKNLTVGDKCYYKVRTYYIVKDVKYYSAFSKVVGATVPSATLNYTKKTLYKGETLTVKLLYTKDTNGIKWLSSDTSVATINSKGKITAKNYGSCYIYAKYNGKTYSCKVTIKRIVPKNIVVVYNGYVTRDNYFIVRFDNEEKKPITIYSSGAYSQDFDYAYYDRNLKLHNGKSSITIKPGESQYIKFKVVGSQTWPDDNDHTIYFKMYLDEKTYWVRTNKNGFEVKINGVWTELY